MKTTSII